MHSCYLHCMPILSILFLLSSSLNVYRFPILLHIVFNFHSIKKTSLRLQTCDSRLDLAIRCFFLADLGASSVISETAQMWGGLSQLLVDAYCIWHFINVINWFGTLNTSVPTQIKKPMINCYSWVQSIPCNIFNFNQE